MRAPVELLGGLVGMVSGLCIAFYMAAALVIPDALLMHECSQLSKVMGWTPLTVTAARVGVLVVLVVALLLANEGRKVILQWWWWLRHVSRLPPADFG